MNHIRIVSLQYRLDVSGRVQYVNPQPIQWSTPIFDAVLEDGVLTCTLKPNYASEAAARAAVDPYVRDWEVRTALAPEMGELRCKYDPEGLRFDVLDPNAPQPREGAVRVSQVGVEVIIAVPTKTAYPVPPGAFRLNPNADTMWHRYQGYLNGREPLQSMAYFCLTVMEYDAGGGRAAACKKLQIDRAVRDKFGDLTSDVGDPRSARKMQGGRPLTSKEIAWIEAAVRAFILRVGEYDPQKPFLTTLSMQDLPSLT